MTRRSGLLLAIIGVVAFVAAACSGGGDSASFPKVVSLGGDQEVFASIRNSGLGVGQNRVEIGLTDTDNMLVAGADVHVRFYDLTGSKPRFVSEADARFVSVQLSYDDESQKAKTAVGQDGVYVSSMRFDRAGEWGAQIAVKRDGRKLKPFTFTFTVLDRTPEPQIGEPAPPSRQAIASQVADNEEIDSSYPPRPQMHEITVADALGTGKPLVVAFATPAFCESRTCGPVMDTVMDPLYERYKDSAIFIHIEPYVLPELRDTNLRDPVPAMREWNLRGEPWLFVVGRNGRILGKYEGIMATDEVEADLQRAISQVTPS